MTTCPLSLTTIDVLSDLLGKQAIPIGDPNFEATAAAAVLAKKELAAAREQLVAANTPVPSPAAA